MAMNKRGVFFTFAAIALAVVIILSANVYNTETYELSEETEAIGIRINTMNRFIQDVEQDLEKGLFIASFRAFLSMGEYITISDSFIINLEDSFIELVLNGTLDNDELSLMQDSTFTDWVDKIKIQADKIDIVVNFTILDVDINQTDPWSVSVDSDINLVVSDKKNTSSWNRNSRIRAEVSIENFEDPLYIINSLGRVTNAIVKTPITDFVNGNDVTNLRIHLNNSYYIASNTSPSYLMRLEGDLGNSSNGIESLVNLQDFVDQGLAIKDRSAVDSIYFSTQSTTNFRINGTPSWFKLDEDHLEIYEAQDVICQLGDICVTE